MLSKQTCTNQTGFHRRQRSTPTLLSLNQPLNLRSGNRGHGAHQRGLSLDRRDSVLGKDEEQQSPNVKSGAIKGQQVILPRMQAAQQPINQPGSGYQQLLASAMDSPRRMDVNGLPDSVMTPTDLDALLSELQTDEMSIDSTLTPRTSALTLRGKMSVSKESQPTPLYERQDADLLQTLPLNGIWTNELSARKAFTPEINTAIDRPQMHPTCGPRKPKEIGAFSIESNHRPPSPSFDPNQTIKASHAMQRGRSYQDNHAYSKLFDRDSESLSPPKTAPLHRRSVDYAVMTSPHFPTFSELKDSIFAKGSNFQAGLDALKTTDATPTMASFQSSPEVPNVSLFESTEVDDVVANAQLSFIQASQDVFTAQDLQHQSSPQQKEQTMTDIDVEECIQDTGITAEEIASFIQGPLPDDQKWSCLFEDTPGKVCGKRFARKENAKSHVQTHLGDRQYVCKVCDTPFVRQHDLKRHFKIHTTDKPHRCPCGKDFHRQDALTRHRQRGMCVGAYDGTPKKQVKRGRPKKPRPSNEERLEKAAKTRQYVLERTKPGSTYASSISESSEYSLPSPPSFDNLSLPASSPSLSHAAFGELQFPGVCSQPLTPPQSPERSPRMKRSPSLSQQGSPRKFASKSPSPQLSSIPEMQTAHPDVQLPAQLRGYHYSSPPELDLSSSSPATSNTLDFTAYSSTSGLPEQDRRASACVNPQILSGDFQLFDGSSRDTDSAIKFEDFIDFSALDAGWSEKPIDKSSTYEDKSEMHSFDKAALSRMEDPFMEL